MTDETRATGDRFGYGWIAAGLPPPVTTPTAYHLHLMQTALQAPPLSGLVLDAGAGEGIDLASVGLTPGCKAVGVELSAGGVRATAARISTVPNARLIQADILSMPFRASVFNHAYSYGVVHHTVDPEKAMREIVRTVKPGGAVLIYVYEDFGRRGMAWRVALALVNAVRRPISRLSPRAIRRVCAIAAPLVYVTCTWPSKHFSWAKRFPYPAAQNPTMRSLIPDLYDRFAAPIEKRYSEAGARALVEQAGCVVKASAYIRGWAVWGEKASEVSPFPGVRVGSAPPR
ncbi:MAG TPA: class I SAM-dependent methyltransferase [Vicinamibacterales bacterium]|nr:class I SAM-dependent methyltransferase [Vicinamibacterales bacterium]